MTKCLTCGHIRTDLELNCPECGSFYSRIIENDLKPADLLNLGINVQQQEKPSLKERFLKLFR